MGTSYRKTSTTKVLTIFSGEEGDKLQKVIKEPILQQTPNSAISSPEVNFYFQMVQTTNLQE